jgi:hypothetical protein
MITAGGGVEGENKSGRMLAVLRYLGVIALLCFLCKCLKLPTMKC